MRNFGIVAVLILGLSFARADGVVCVDPIPTKGSWKGNDTGATPKSVFTIQIDDLPAQSISASSSGVFLKLRVAAKHTVKIKMGGKPYASFEFSFEDRGGHHLRLWYKQLYGTWQLQKAAEKHECAFLKKQKKRAPNKEPKAPEETAP